MPNPNWLRPGTISARQQAFGDAMLKAHPFMLIPSVVSGQSWTVVFDPAVATGCYSPMAQERFALDTRLHPPTRGGAEVTGSAFRCSPNDRHACGIRQIPEVASSLGRTHQGWCRLHRRPNNVDVDVRAGPVRAPP